MKHSPFTVFMFAMGCLALLLAMAIRPTGVGLFEMNFVDLGLALLGAYRVWQLLSRWWHGTNVVEEDRL